MELNIAINTGQQSEQLVEDKNVKRMTKRSKQRRRIAIWKPKCNEKNKKWAVEGVEKGWRSHVVWSWIRELNITINIGQSSEQVVEDKNAKRMTKGSKQERWIAILKPKPSIKK